MAGLSLPPPPLCLVYAMFSFATHHLNFVGWMFGMQLKIGATTILYDKILRLRLSSLGQVCAADWAAVITL